jgi:hypothetical protein
MLRLCHNSTAEVAVYDEGSDDDHILREAKTGDSVKSFDLTEELHRFGYNLDPDVAGEELRCEVCGKDLTDPKNAGDPDENGNWVCRDGLCRWNHDVEMTCNPGGLFG